MKRLPIFAAIALLCAAGCGDSHHTTNATPTVTATSTAAPPTATVPGTTTATAVAETATPTGAASPPTLTATSAPTTATPTAEESSPTATEEASTPTATVEPPTPTATESGSTATPTLAGPTETPTTAGDTPTPTDTASEPTETPTIEAATPTASVEPTASASPAPAFHLVEATISDIHAAIERHELTCVELVSLYLKRIAAYNGVCVESAGRPARLHHADRQCRPDQRAHDAQPAAGGTRGVGLRRPPRALAHRLGRRRPVDARRARDRGGAGSHSSPPPVSWSGRCTASSWRSRTSTTPSTCAPRRAWTRAYANDRPPDDATFVSRLRQAGAIILAKANLGEWPRDRRAAPSAACSAIRTTRRARPGRSSGGSAASVAANLVTCSIGEETGGSILHPVEEQQRLRPGADRRR